MAEANVIVESKTVEAAAHGKTVHAIMIAADVLDPSTLSAFVGEVIERFKVQRLASPPNTTHFLLTVRGKTTAAAIKRFWSEHLANDHVLGVLMRKMQVADVVRGARTGPAVEQVSLLLS
jgi:hypothetical protein